MQREQRARRERRTVGGVKQLPWRTYRNPYKPIEVLSEEQIERIHDASMRDAGRDRHGVPRRAGAATAQSPGRGGGARHAARALRPPAGAENVAKAPAEFTLHARNPERNLTFGGNHLNFGSVASAPNVSDLDKGRRPGNFEDYCNLVRLMPEPQHRPVPRRLSGRAGRHAAATRHLDCHYAAITLTDKHLASLCAGPQRISDAIDMICIARGISTASS